MKNCNLAIIIEACFFQYFDKKNKKNNINDFDVDTFYFIFFLSKTSLAEF